MRTIQDLYPLKLYSNKQRVYIPFNVTNKKKGSAILLLGTSIEDSIRMMNHPAVYNPNIYRHYYMDRSIVPLVDGTGIKPEEFDEVHEAALSEAIAHIKDSSKMKINIIGANSIERNYIKRVFNEDTVRRHFHNLRVKKLPAEINIVVCSAKEAKVKGKMAGRNGKVYEISQNSHIDLETNTIYLMNLYEYKDAGEPDGKYEIYVASNLTELACQIGYPDAPTLLIDYISMALSGFCTQIEEDILKGKKERRYISEKGWTVAWGVYRMLQDEGYSGMVDLLNGEGYADLAKYTTSQSIRQFRADIYGQYSEATLTAEQRKNMKSSDYGLPDQKKYPMPDEAHVRAAIRFFNHVDEKDEKKLAAAIKRKIRDYGMTVKVGENNRFAKYYHEGGIYYNYPRIRIYSEKVEKFKNVQAYDVNKLDAVAQGRSSDKVSYGMETYSMQSNPFESIARKSPDLLSDAKLKAVAAADDIVKEFNRLFMGMWTESLTRDAEVIQKNTAEYDEEYGPGVGFVLSHGEIDVLSVMMNNDVMMLSQIEGYSLEEATDIVVKNFLPESLTEAGCRQLIKTRMDKSKAYTKALTIMLQKNYQYLNLTEAEAKMMIEGLKDDEKSGKLKDIIQKMTNDPEFTDKFKVKEGVYEFSKLGGGTVLISLNGESDMNIIAKKPGKYLQNIFEYDCIVFAHGGARYGEADGKPEWFIEDVQTKNSAPTDNVVDLLKQLRSEGYRKVLMTSCNPGSIQLPDDLANDKNFTVYMGDHSVYKEDFSVDPFYQDLCMTEAAIDSFMESNGMDDNKTLGQIESEFNAIYYGMNEGVGDVLKNLIKKAIQFIITIWKKIIEFFKSVWAKVKNFFRKKPESLVNAQTKKPVSNVSIVIENGKASVKKQDVSTIGAAQKNAQNAVQSIYNEISKVQKQEKDAIDKLQERVDKGQFAPPKKQQEKKEDTEGKDESVIWISAEVINEHKLISKIDDDWKPKGHKDLNKYRTIPIKGLTGDTFYAKKLPILKHINPDHDVTIWMNGSDPVAVGACRDDADPDIKWLTALEIADNYKGYGLGPQVLEYMTKVKGCNALSVFRKNEVAKAMYEKYGYRESEPSKEGIKAGQQKMHFMYYGQKVIKKMNKPTSPDIQHEGSFMRSDFGDILTICSHLETAEFKRISFTETYQDSPFVAKRIIKREGYTPAGFMELYHFPSRPGEAQIVTAVDPRFRGKGLAKSMLAEMLAYVKESRTDIDRLIWTVHPGNVASSTIAEAAGFSKMDGYDCHGRMVYEKYMSPQTDANPITEAVMYDSNGIIQEIAGIPFVMMEADDRESKIFSTNIRRYLTRERMRTNSRVTAIYTQIKVACPQIKKTYLKLPQYKSENCFVDLFYYHQVFLQHMTYKMDKGVRFYFDFLNRMLHNPDVDNMYQNKTVFFPVPNLQGKSLDEYMDYKKGINFFSMLNRLVRSAPQDVISAWGDTTFVFLGTTGYFKINFNNFSVRTMVRVKKNLSKLAYNQPIIPAEEDAEMPESPKEADKIDKENLQMTANHSKAATIAMATDEIENRTGVKINNLAGDGRDVNQSMCTGEPFTMYDHGFNYDDYWTNEKMKGTAIITVGKVPKGSSLERILKYSVRNKYKL
ncbi:GNAT family N-acetyltransferase [uncultured Duncaniella sp.]|uniref:GNAT family N-acetyltransferase n=1 Tax=uncultured Duncaniella sp. TaxID=2768039 RepID=UPI00261379C6|nr:GNAT family N-acetyltransferase [uncultured Duncaniella sp.]